MWNTFDLDLLTLKKTVDKLVDTLLVKKRKKKEIVITRYKTESKI
mgnify:CR=1 FL=1